VRPFGGVAERSNAAVSKTVSGLWVRRGFKSLPLRFLLAVLVALALPPAANAHGQTGRVAVDDRAEVLRKPPGVAVRIYASDLAVRLREAGARRVVVLGYVGEPFIRIGPAGAVVSRASPTAGGARAVVHGRSVVWHDARVRGLASGVARKRWTIPLIVDGRRTAVEGQLWRVEPPPAWPWIVLGVPFLVVAAWLLAVRPQHWVRVAAVAFGLAAAVGMVVTGAGFALNGSASEGKWVEAGNELVFALVGVAFVLRGKPDTRAIAGGALGLLGLAIGLSDLAVFRHGVVLSALPADLVRTIVALVIAAGAVATCTGLVVFSAAMDAPLEDLGGEDAR
jgi:hypothetical protein